MLFKQEATAQDVFPKECDTICFQHGDLFEDKMELIERWTDLPDESLERLETRVLD